MNNDPTVERLNFLNYSDATVEHLHRYAITLEFISNKVVLDIASGEGYGSYLMSKKAQSVFGVDIDGITVENALKKYKNANLKYLQGGANNIPFEDKSMDVVVSFETIEHHDQHDEMFAEIKRVLKPNGLLIMSSPDKKYYSDKTGYINKFHIKELYFEEFKSLAQNYFNHTSFYFQKAYNLNSYISDALLFETTTVFSGNPDILLKESMEPLYNIVLASNHKELKLQPSIFNGKLISNAVLEAFSKKKIQIVKKSTSFKLGSFLISPFSNLKRFFN